VTDADAPTPDEPNPALYAVVGRPVLHSRSPQLYRAAFHEAGIDAVYTRLTADSADEALTVARRAGMAGLNVTAPYKADVVPLLDRVDASARALGAANTVVFRDGEATGHDTDPDGVRAMLREARIDPRGQRIVLLGAGGAARAAAHALAEAGAAEVTFVNRTEERGRRTAEDLGGRFVPWEEAPAALAACDLAISCVPPDVDRVHEGWIDPDLPILDACYVRSMLAARALAWGWNYLGGGVTWLMGQALASFRAFTGIEAPEEAMVRSMIDAQYRRRPPRIALCGMMGSGKSATGRALSEARGWPLVDTDARVEAAAAATVAEIFARDGEVAFRAREALEIRAALQRDPAVIALGGGALLEPDMRQRVQRSALTVWLATDPDTCAERARGGTRPLLGEDPTPEDVARRLAQRLPGYARTADLVLDPAGRTPQEVAALIADEFDRTWPT